MEIVLAHGASGNAASMSGHVEGLRQRNLAARAIDLPLRRAEVAVADFRRQLPQPASTLIGGQSYGGRVASLLAAEESVAGLILFSYPLHRPGHPEWRPRTEHWPGISCPVLLLSGESDPFARLDLLRLAVGQLPTARLVTYPRVGHGLRGRLDDALDEVARWAGQLAGR
jgi:predicted alpha/beta-hydrolase family hydrolase